jgi:hypothetical protein
VIAGDIKAGRHTILVGSDIDWSNSAATVESRSTSIIITDVDARRPNVWCLTRASGWIKGDPKTYLAQDTWCGVRHAVLEPYFVALRSKNPTAEVARLLASKESEVVVKAIEWMCGGSIPWPVFVYYGDAWSPASRPKSRALIDDIRAMEPLLARKEPEVRFAAACAVGELAGKRSVPQLQRLLSDPAPQVRAVAIVVLARHEDRESSEAINAAVQGIDEAFVANQVIQSLAQWKNSRTAPALIGYLQNDGFDSPAVEAQTALKSVTGHWFPLDVEASRDIWKRAREIPDDLKRRSCLRCHPPQARVA